MTELLTAAQMRAIEQAAIDSGEVTGLELMERAGVGVVEAILEEWPEMAFSPQKAVVLCGPGNNGGDGFVVARLLKQRGWKVEVFLYGDEAKLPVDAKTNCQRWIEMGGIHTFQEIYNTTFFPRPLVIDAIFGLGLSRSVPEDVQNVLMMCLNCPRVSIDVPSIVDSDSGVLRTLWPNHTKISTLTVTFAYAKRCHYLGNAANLSKKLVVKPVGLNFSFAKILPPEASKRVFLIDEPSFQLAKGTLAHKFFHGHALILSGPSGTTGAARLAARGALRIGTGVVSIACPPDAVAENAAQLNAIMITPVADATALNTVLQDKRINAVCVGPALGLTDEKAALVREVLASNRNTVLDADALTLLSKDAELFGMLHENCVLTPHAGEFARLFPDIAIKLAKPATKGPAYSKVDATREAAKRSGCVVLYKGADTVIADPQGRASINSAHYERSAPWLATAGSGDVLAGFITGLMARGFAPMQAAETGAWLHVECALEFGAGLIAEDIPEQLPKVFSDLGV